MKDEIDAILANLKAHVQDSTQKTHKKLIDNLSSLTIHLDRDAIEVDFSFPETRSHGGDI